ncbi:MAG: hypothetical protein K2X27_10235 [Candidatus Obscuribacterales bacterium]|nr:hypothetical protein [Candidatus Obscuribacterales bacterium]
MSMQVRVDALKQQLEQLFPGKWFNQNLRQRNLETGLEAIDTGITRGIARKRITEWIGAVSSGKTTLLRNAVSHWCAAGLNVAYIDSEGKLYAADWASIGRTKAKNKVSELQSYREEKGLADRSAASFEAESKGKFWIIRPDKESNLSEDGTVPLLSKQSLLVQEAIWSADQFIRSNAFDVVILDLGSNDLGKKNQGMGYAQVPSKIYARLQRALDKSKAALIIVSDTEAVSIHQSESQKQAAALKSNNWGAHARFMFNRGMAVRTESGLNGVAMINPSIKLSAWRDGISQEMEVTLGSAVPNRLLTHSQVPDRRTSKG